MSLVDIIYYIALSHLNKATYQYAIYKPCKILDLCIRRIQVRPRYSFRQNETNLYHYFKDYYGLDIEKVKTTLVLFRRI